MRGIIDRRILANYRVDPDSLRRVLPSPLRPSLVGGFAVAGICLIRLKKVRPRGVPAFMGVSSENAAHRIAVEWDDEDAGGVRQGVYIPRRDTSSRLNVLAGGRLFPGVHHHARFDVAERGDAFHVAMVSDDGQTRVSIDARRADDLPGDSIFGGTDEASEFFRKGSLGYSPSGERGRLDGLELHTLSWSVEPLAVERIESSFFDDHGIWPTGAVQFDCALLMRRIAHEWHERSPMCVTTPALA